MNTAPFPQRPCPVCSSAPGPGLPQPRLLYRQSFAAFSSGSLLDGYDVVICNECGAAYADRIPEQSEFDSYYAAMSKYEAVIGSGATPPAFQYAASLLAPFLAPQTRIADVGCATGAFLGELKRRGFCNVLGFDPSCNCCTAARRLHDVEVRESTIRQLDTVRDRFDLLMCTGVLEHLRDVQRSLELMVALLEPHGRMFVAVPDASHYHRWFSAPYQHFSMEHVNFFSPCSLTNLMNRHGFRPLHVERYPHALGRNAIEPVIMALFERVPAETAIEPSVFDDETVQSLEAYVAASRKTELRMNSIIADLVDRQTPLLVWGAGTHTLRLLITSPLRNANIVAYVDRNRNYQGKMLAGRPILAPEKLRGIDATILISSHVAEPEIKDFIQTELVWPVPPICLYQGETTAACDATQ